MVHPVALCKQSKIKNERSGIVWGIMAHYVDFALNKKYSNSFNLSEKIYLYTTVYIGIQITDFIYIIKLPQNR